MVDFRTRIHTIADHLAPEEITHEKNQDGVNSARMLIVYHDHPFLISCLATDENPELRITTNIYDYDPFTPIASLTYIDDGLLPYLINTIIADHLNRKAEEA